MSQTLGNFTHWIFAALLTTVFPKMVTAFSPGTVFLFFCGVMMRQLIWVMIWVPTLPSIKVHLRFVFFPE